MYFNYRGRLGRDYDGGHCVMGLPSLSISKEYYFAEGTTRSGFEEWLTIQNFSRYSPLLVKATFQLGEGQGEIVERTYEVPASYRHTVFVPEVVGEGKDVSVKLSSDITFMAERPMYFEYAYTDFSAQGGHCVIGATSPAREWFLAEGCTGGGFDEWLCLQNPGDDEATIEVTYYTQEVGAMDPKTTTILPGTRKTLMVNEDVGGDYQLSCGIRVISGPDVIVERPMYFNHDGYDGGHDVVGYMP
jgi:hypothetical protein